MGVKFQEPLRTPGRPGVSEAGAPGEGGKGGSSRRRSLSQMREAVLGSRRGSISLGRSTEVVAKEKSIKFEPLGLVSSVNGEEEGPAGGDTSACGGDGGEGGPRKLNIAGLRALVLGSRRGSVSLGTRKVKGVQFLATVPNSDGNSAGDGHTGGDLKNLGEKRVNVLGSSRGSLSFGLKKVAQVQFDDGVMEGVMGDEEFASGEGEREGKAQKLTEQRSKVLGGRRGSLSFGLKKVRLVQFDDDQTDNAPVVVNHLGSEGEGEGEGKGQGLSLAEQRKKVLGSRRGSITLALSKFKMVRFSAGSQGPEAAQEPGSGGKEEESILEQRSKVLGSRRGSIALGRKKVTAVQMGGVEAEEEGGVACGEVKVTSAAEDSGDEGSGERFNLQKIKMMARRGRTSFSKVRLEAAGSYASECKDDEQPGHLNEGGLMVLKTARGESVDAAQGDERPRNGRRMSLSFLDAGALHVSGAGIDARSAGPRSLLRGHLFGHSYSRGRTSLSLAQRNT